MVRTVKQNYFFNRNFKKLNLDITHRCPLECHLCGRQRSFRYKGLKVPGRDLSLTDFDKISNFFPKISFCGQYSDPIHHPQFIDILQICKEKNIDTEIHVASSHKKIEWFIKAFQVCPDAEWIFGIDGLPEESHRYRKNQDGVKLFEIMKESKNYLKKKPVWQYILFRYNQNDLQSALKIANDNGFQFFLIDSARFDEGDPFKPTIRGIK